jgi:ABC-2 type transport system permease protein
VASLGVRPARIGSPWTPYWRAYLEFWRLNFLTLAEYRANFFVWLVFTVVLHGSAVLTVWLMMQRFPIMHGWTWQQVVFLYSLYMLAHTLSNTFFFSVGEVPYQIREGRFDRFLVRPLDPLFQVLTQPGQIWPDELAVAIVFFAVMQALVHLQWSVATVLVLLGAMVGGAFIDFAIQLGVATLAFWVIRLDTLRWVVMSLETDFTRYPLSIYNRIVRFTLSFVFPFAFMNYFPASTLLHKSAEHDYTVNPVFGWLTLVVGGVWFAAAYWFWRRGLNHYQGTGS